MPRVYNKQPKLDHYLILILLNAHGDELGRLPLTAVRLAVAGASAAPPDLAGDMAQTSERIARALAQEGMAPALDPLGLRLAVSRALLAPSEGEIKVPVQVRFLDGLETGPVLPSDTGDGIPHGSTPQADAAAITLGDEWGDLFVLDDDRLETDVLETDVLEGNFE